MSRPIVTTLVIEDTDGNVYEVRVLGASDNADDKPTALIAVDLPDGVVDVFAKSRTVTFDVSDTPIVALASAMATGMMGPAGG